MATSDSGGAGQATLRLHKTFLEEGWNSCLLVKNKLTFERGVVEFQNERFKNSYLYQILNRTGNLIEEFFGIQDYKTDPNYCFFNKVESENGLDVKNILKQIPFLPDLIIAGWISKFINTSTLNALQRKTRAKLHWWTTDMGPLTGGCHYSNGCMGYTMECNNCPAITDKSKKNQAAINLKLKRQFIRQGNIGVLAGSDQLFRQATNSTLFKSQITIPKVLMPIDSEIFTNTNRKIAKQILDIPLNKRVIFTGATDNREHRKGGEYLKETINELNKLIAGLENGKLSKDDIVIVIAGSNGQNDWFNDMPFKKLFLNFISDERYLSLVYQAADVYLCTSIEDSGPMMINESLMCGTPVVCFDIGVSRDLVLNQKTGYRASLKDSINLGKGLFEILNLPQEEYTKISQQARELAIKKTSKHVAFEKIKDICK